MDILNLFESKKVKGDKKLIIENHNFIEVISFLDIELVKKLISKTYEESLIKNFSNKLIDVQKYNILGIGGYGIIFEIENNKCIKLTLNFTNKKPSDEYNIPILLSEKNSELKKLINIPLCYIEDVKIDGICSYLKLVYSLMVLVKNPNINKEIYKKKIEKIKPNLNFNDSDISKYFYIYKQYITLPNIIVFNRIKDLIKIIKKFKDKDHLNYDKILIIYNKAISSSNNYIYNLYEVENPKIFYQSYLRTLFLHVILFLLKSNEKSFFVHKDLKPDNILVFHSKYNYTLSYKKYKFIFKNKIIFKINDFSFSLFNDDKDVIDNKIIYNLFYDIHYFTHFFFYYFNNIIKKYDENLLNFLYKTYIEPYCKQEINDINSLIDIKEKDVKCSFGKFKTRVEYTSEDLENDILKNNLFKKFYSNNND